MQCPRTIMLCCCAKVTSWSAGEKSYADRSFPGRGCTGPNFIWFSGSSCWNSLARVVAYAISPRWLGSAAAPITTCFAMPASRRVAAWVEAGPGRGDLTWQLPAMGDKPRRARLTQIQALAREARAPLINRLESGETAISSHTIHDRSISRPAPRRYGHWYAREPSAVTLGLQVLRRSTKIVRNRFPQEHLASNLRTE